MKAILAAEALLIGAALTVAADVYAHKRVEALGGVNVWGYRGPVAHQRQPNEVRIAVVGGTRAFGWGLPATALTSEIRRQIMLTTDRPGAPLRPIVVINLGRLSALPDSYPRTIERFAYLQPDYVCLYDDLGERGAVETGASAVFEVSGYQPALPLVLREKGMVWRYGAVGTGYARQVRGDMPIVRRTAGAVLQHIGETAGAIDRGIGTRLGPGRSTADTTPYVGAMTAAIDAAHGRARGVLVVMSPAETTRQIENRRALNDRLAARAASSPWLRVVDLTDDEALARHPDFRLDGWNYASAGIARVAERIASALLTFIARIGA